MMNKFLLVILACLISTSLQAWNCKYEKIIKQELDLAGSEELIILAAAGDLEVEGARDVSTATIRGRVCVSEEEWLAESRVDVQEGRQAEIVVELPAIADSWSLLGQTYAYIDLKIRVPEGMRLDIKDSSGDVEVAGAAAIKIKDSSGDILIEDISGPVTLHDSSGDVVLRDIEGDVTVESDSSGDLSGSDIEGSVLVNRDSSGDIRFIDVGRDFTVERDSSGDITAKGVGGDFKVLADGSGDVVATKVNGEVLMPNG
jgi:DUF4097 and DUF4098 domain-containing protein YvlB